MSNPFQTSNEDQLGESLLGYLRNELDDSSLAFQTPLTLLGKGHGGGIYTFKLQNPPIELTNTLVLRFSPTIPKEGIIQKALTKQGYPTSHIHFHEMTPNILGKPFLVRNYHTGTVLWEEQDPIKRSEIMAENHAKLHQIDHKPVLKALEENKVIETTYLGGWPLENMILHKDFSDIDMGPDWRLENDIDWLIPGVEWIRENKVKPIPTVAHGDFHPHNILVENGAVKTVIDWQNSRIMDVEYDIAASLTILLQLGPALREERLNTELIERYLEFYNEFSEIDEERLRYFEGMICLSYLCAMEMGFTVFSLPGVCDRLMERFKQVSGIQLIR